MIRGLWEKKRRFHFVLRSICIIFAVKFVVGHAIQAASKKSDYQIL